VCAYPGAVTVAMITPPSIVCGGAVLVKVRVAVTTSVLLRDAVIVVVRGSGALLCIPRLPMEGCSDALVWFPQYGDICALCEAEVHGRFGMRQVGPTVTVVVVESISVVVAKVWVKVSSWVVVTSGSTVDVWVVGAAVMVIVFGMIKVWVTYIVAG
jgi:hypothetical protein